MPGYLWAARNLTRPQWTGVTFEGGEAGKPSDGTSPNALLTQNRARPRPRFSIVAVIWPRKSGQVFGYGSLFNVRRARWFSYSIGER